MLLFILCASVCFRTLLEARLSCLFEITTRGDVLGTPYLLSSETQTFYSEQVNLNKNARKKERNPR